MNFIDVCNEYYKFINTKYKVTTILQIKRKFKNYIIPYFKKYKIEDINTSIYIEFINYIIAQGYSSSFNQHIISIMKSFYNFIAASYDLDNIPLKLGKMKLNTSHITNKKNIWSIKEFKKFIKKVDDPVYHALFNTLFFTGVRKGEALALTFSDLSKNHLSINKSITKELFNGERLIMTPKTENATRNIIIPKKLYKELLKSKLYYLKHDIYNLNFVFGGNLPISTTTLERKKNYYCDLANVKRIRIHDFRHSHATLLYDKKIKLKYIQERLGHADIATTLNTYVHNNEKYEKRVLRTLNFMKSKF